jgi:SanA protein
MKKQLKLILILLTTVFIGCFFLADYLIVRNAENKIFDRVETCPKVTVALVLGTSKNNKKGKENKYFTYRIEAVVDLFNAGKVTSIIVSGDNGSKSYDEPTAMKNALIEAGIPENQIHLDYAGFRTLDSMERALKVFGQKKVIVVSQRFHNERAIYLGEHFGMTVYGFNAKDVSASVGFKTQVRERFARMKVFWDIIFGVESKFLGEPVQINSK